MRTGIERLPLVFQQAINKKLKVLFSVDLSSVDDDMQSLKTALEPYRSHEFGEKEKIVFMHFDTDYYIDMDQPGITLHNLIKILYSLDIGMSHCLLVTNHYRIEKEIMQCYTRFGIFDQVMPVIFTAFDEILIADPEQGICTIDANINCIEKQFSILNGTQRAHRDAFMSLILLNDFHHKGLISFKHNQ